MTQSGTLVGKQSWNTSPQTPSTQRLPDRFPLFFANAWTEQPSTLHKPVTGILSWLLKSSMKPMALKLSSSWFNLLHYIPKIQDEFDLFQTWQCTIIFFCLFFPLTRRRAAVIDFTSSSFSKKKKGRHTSKEENDDTILCYCFSRCRCFFCIVRITFCPTFWSEKCIFV